MSNSTHLSSALAQVERQGLIEAVRHVPAAVAIVDASGLVVYENERARALAEGLAADLGARTIRSGKEVIDAESSHIRADGRRAFTRWSSSPIRDAEGRIAAAVVVLADVTVEKEAEQRLSYFERLLENTDDAIVGTDAEFRVTDWSPGAERLYGYGVAEVLGRFAREVASFDGDQSRPRLEDDLLGSGRTRSEFTAVRKDGTSVEVEMIAVALHDDRGEVTGYLGIHRDMTERRRWESEQRLLASIIENSSDFIGIADLDLRPLFLNEAGRRLVGFGDADIAQASVLDFFAPSDRDFVANELLPVIMEKGRWPAAMELQLRHVGDGRLIPVLWDAFRIDDPGTGEPIALATITRDISEREKAERERQARARQQAVVAELGLLALRGGEPQAVMDGAVSAVSRTLSVELAAVAEVLPARDQLLFRAGVGWREGTIGEVTVIWDDVTSDERFEGSPILTRHGVVSVLSVVIRGPDEPFGALGAFTRERRTFTREDVNFMQAVANVISIAYEAARTERRLNEVREAERRRLARDLHDEALQGLAQALAEAATSSDRTVETLKAVGRQLRAAIYDLRLGEDEDGRLADRLKEIVDLQAAITAEIDFELEVADGTPDVEGYRATQVLRVVSESLTSARRHSGAATIRVVASGSEFVLTIEVLDDGAAHPSELMGLSERAALIGAKLEIDSNPGGGTAVRLELPLTGGAQEQAPVRILLVEDHVAVREAIAAMFERERDFTVVGQAGSCAEARDMLEGVDLAVLDFYLPDGLGSGLIKELHAANPDADALVLSAGLDPANTARAVRNGAAGVLDKASRLDEVLETVRRLRAGDTLLSRDEIVELISSDRLRRDQEQDDRLAIETLTERELDVLRLIAEGLDSQAIALRLHITERTERNHVANILGKLDLHSRLQALVFCLRYGVVEIPRSAS